MIRIKAHCDDGCPWYLYASFDRGELFCDNVDEGVVDEGTTKGIIVRVGRNRNAPTGIDKDSASKEWDDLNSDEEELELLESDEEG